MKADIVPAGQSWSGISKHLLRELIANNKPPSTQSQKPNITSASATPWAPGASTAAPWMQWVVMVELLFLPKLEKSAKKLCCPQEGTNIRLSQQQQSTESSQMKVWKDFYTLLISGQRKNSKTEWKMEANAATAQPVGPQFWVLHGKTVMVKIFINK